MSVNAATLQAAIHKNITRRSVVVSDGNNKYQYTVGMSGGKHRTVRHDMGQYVRGDVPTNTVEGFFSLLRKRIVGTHHAVSKVHLHRYVSEAAFIYSNRDCDDEGDPGRAQQAAGLPRASEAKTAGVT